MKDVNKFHLKYCNMKHMQLHVHDSGFYEMDLCVVCCMYFDSHTGEQTSDIELVWPAMIWQWFVKTEEHEEQVAVMLWSFIPIEWQSWWIDEHRACFSWWLDDISIDCPWSVIGMSACRKQN